MNIKWKLKDRKIVLTNAIKVFPPTLNYFVTPVRLNREHHIFHILNL